VKTVGADGGERDERWAGNAREGRLGLIYDIQRTSVHDGPGIRTTVFFKGCPLHCAWCHNPESTRAGPDLFFYEDRCIVCGPCVPVCPEDALEEKGGRLILDRGLCTSCGLCADVCPANALVRVGRWVSVDQVVEEMERDRVFYGRSGGGVTLSGGEPMAQSAFAGNLLQRAKEEGLDTAMETCGAAAWSRYESVLPWLDMVIFDLKVTDALDHRRLTGAGNELILANARRLAKSGIPLRFRTPVIPGENDSSREWASLAGFLKSLDAEHQPEFQLLPYHPLGTAKYDRLGRPYEFADLKPPTSKQMTRYREGLREAGVAVLE